ncbi:MAG: hypothetical protein FD127_3625 [Acidimicrobiaceae bacterium]|nr:MAG: hypothetical protein FD127_3625 [Acidimicrobiaceae bacterium]
MIGRRRGSPRQLDWFEGGEAAGEERLVASELAAERGERISAVVVEQPERGADIETEGTHRVCHRHLGTGSGLEDLQRQGAVGGGHDDLAVDLEHLAGFTLVVAHFAALDDQHLAVRGDGG